MENIPFEREQQHHVSSKLIQVWAEQTAYDDGLTDFVASHGWLQNFMSRFNLSLRRQTTTEQIKPSDLQEKLLNFVEFNKKQRELHNFERAMIANMDETPI